MSESISHRIISADSRRMPETADSSVHLVVTSPPYWQLKDYGPREGQIGFGQSYEEYINSLNLVWSECARVLHPGCRMAVNVGDQFARAAHYGRYKVIPIRAEVIRCCEAVGLDYMGAVIWRKVTNTSTTGGGSVMGSFPYPRNGILRIDYEFILLFKKPGKAPRPDKRRKAEAALSAAEWREYFSGHWSFPGARGKKHLAAFPEELPRRLIRMFTFGGETVLDPFAGSGTVAAVAAGLGRGSVGYEVEEKFLPEIERRLAGADPPATADIIRPDRGPVDPGRWLEGLPYRFMDPVGLRAKVDPREENYGSVVNVDSPPREEYFSVREVLSPVELTLDSGETVRLLGLQPLENRRGRAIGYLRELVDGRRVYVRTEPDDEGSDGPRAVYLYLKNRTFVNARLIREGLARADRSGEYSRKKRFLELERKKK